MYCQTHRIFGPQIRQDQWRSVPLQHGGGLGSFLVRMGTKFMPMLKKVVPAAAKVAKKVAT